MFISCFNPFKSAYAVSNRSNATTSRLTKLIPLVALGCLLLPKGANAVMRAANTKDLAFDRLQQIHRAQCGSVYDVNKCLFQEEENIVRLKCPENLVFYNKIIENGKKTEWVKCISGTSYKGDFNIIGLLNGDGISFFASEESRKEYEGKWALGKWNGEGIEYRYDQTKKREGIWEEGVFSQGNEYSEDGKTKAYVTPQDLKNRRIGEAHQQQGKIFLCTLGMMVGALSLMVCLHRNKNKKQAQKD